MLVKHKKSIALILSISVALLTLFVYLPALQNQFVTWDDPEYVYDNPHILTINTDFFEWAFFDFYFANWHPLTWLSHAIDYKIWKLNPLGHHLTSVLIHTVNTFLVMTIVILLCSEAIGDRNSEERPVELKTLAAGTVTGLLFGLHPLHVESVAWVSERKDVLCAFFFLLSSIAYLKYVKAQTGKTQSNPFAIFVDKKYLSAFGLFMLSLLSKPMSATLPVLLLILDWYPLRRLKKQNVRIILLEKLPFFALSIGCAIIAFYAQRSGAALTSLVQVPLFPRLLMGSKAVIAYLGKMLWPSNLAPFYPYPRNIGTLSLSTPEYFIPLLLIISITAFCLLFLYVKKQRMWLAAWCYYLVTLLPVIGIIKLGGQSMADRYTYLPSIAPFIVLGIVFVWILDKLTGSIPQAMLRTVIYSLFAVFLIVPISYATVKQTRIWENGGTLWSKEIEMQPEVARAYLNRGKYYTEIGQFEKALNDFSQAITLDPDSPKNFYDRGTCFFKLGLYEEALHDLSQAIRLSHVPVFEYYNNRAIVFAKMNRLQEALEDYSLAIKINPASPEPYYNRGNIFTRIGSYSEALDDYTRAIKLSPLNSDYYNNRSVVYRQLGQYQNAVRDFYQARLLRETTPVTGHR
jgi:tetratricopeptide (TPR) repeat protein